VWPEENGISVVLRIKSVAWFLRKCGELLWIGGGGMAESEYEEK
jgi:hypothetical protein